MTRIPFIVFGDGPRLPTGLARIALDLCARFWSVSEELGIRVIQVGVDEPEGWHVQYGWEVYGFQPTLQDFGRSALTRVLLELQEQGEHERPVVLAITDPARVYDLVRPWLPTDRYHTNPATLATFWGYFPIDAHNQQGCVGGPAAECVRAMDRVLGYGRYGADVLKVTLGRGPNAPQQVVVPYLPHGIDTRTFCRRPVSEADTRFQVWLAQLPQGTRVIGAVATNQPRKDLGLLCSSVAAFHQETPAALWLHTDKLTGTAWDVGELVRQNGLSQAQVFVSQGYVADSHLAARYSASDVTIAPGLGEGFGYPIVESLSCGTPVVHGDYAGGVELIPHDDWLFPPQAWRVESVYALLRPVFKPRDVVDALQRALRWPGESPEELQAFCRGAVRYLDWQFIWPYWRSWVGKGLDRERRRRSELGGAAGRFGGDLGAGRSGGRDEDPSLERDEGAGDSRTPSRQSL